MPNAFDELGSTEPYVPNYLQDDIQFRIDNDLRTIAIPADGVVLGVVGDKNVNHVNFQMPAWYNGFDMSTFQARINFIDAGGNANYYTVTDMTVMTPEGTEVSGTPGENDIVYFTWLVDSYATGYVGQVRFNVRLTKHDTSVSPAVLSQAFNTQINSCQVLEGIQLADEITQEQAEDLLFHYSSELGDITEGYKHDLEEKAVEMLATIPDDYEALGNEVNNLNTLSGVVQNDVTIEARNQFVALKSSGPGIEDAGGGPFATSTVIPVSKRSTVLFEAAGYNTRVSMITSCSSDGTNMRDTVMCTDSNVNKYFYYATEDTYVKLSFNYNKTYKLTILEPKANDSLYKTINKFALLSSDQNITSTSFDLNNCEPNRIYMVSVNCVNCPESAEGGLLITIARSNTAEHIYSQTLFDTTGVVHTRFKKYGGTWTGWQQLLSKNSPVLQSTDLNITSTSFDLNNCEPNKFYMVTVNCVNCPEMVEGGIVLTIARNNAAEHIYSQTMFDTTGFIHTRFKRYGGTWTQWQHILSKNSPVLQSSGSNVLSTSFDLNDCEPNKIYLVSVNCVNSPYASGGVCYTVALKNDSQHIYPQFFTGTNGKLYIRFKQYGGAWTSWTRLLNETDSINTVNNENIKTYAQLSLFSKIGVIGDSYASGEIYTTIGNQIGDIYRISWLQQLARRNGFTGYNFSKGGLTTRTWLTDDKGLSLLNSSDACKLYILALGINDYNSLGESYIGAETDMGTNADTYYGNYAKIINAILTKSSTAKIIICKLAIRNDVTSEKRTLITKFNNAIVKIGSHFGIPVANIDDDVYFNSDTYKNLMYGGHPSAVGYSALATAYEKVLSETMIQNHGYFEDADFSDE